MFKYPKIETLFERDENFKVTDKIRLSEFENIKNWLITEKIDGTNIRVIYTPEDKLLIRGRTDKASIPTFLLEELQKIFTIEKVKSILDNPIEKGMCLYGEGYGAKIQKGGGDYNLCIRDIESAVNIVKNESMSVVAEEENGKFIPFEGIVARAYPTMLFRNGIPIKWKLKVKDFKKEANTNG